MRKVRLIWFCNCNRVTTFDNHLKTALLIDYGNLQSPCKAIRTQQDAKLCRLLENQLIK